jgi:hypothetical protein
MLTLEPNQHPLFLCFSLGFIYLFILDRVSHFSPGARLASDQSPIYASLVAGIMDIQCYVQLVS